MYDMEIDIKRFSYIVDQIRNQGYDEDTAADYAAFVSDNPVKDAEGKLPVIDEQSGRLLARLEPIDLPRR